MRWTRPPLLSKQFSESMTAATCEFHTESLSGVHMALEPLLETLPRIEALATPVPEDVCTIMYTSGTTGPSKGVLMPQGHCYLFVSTVAA